MKSNLAQQPCTGKCSKFKVEQCRTCLITDIEKKEFDLGVAPDDAYVSGDYLHGDVVVLKELDPLCVSDLITLKRFDGMFWETDHRIGRVSENTIRQAIPLELKFKRRLTDAEIALAEVS